MVEEYLPAGTTLIENSVQTSATSYTLGRRPTDLLFLRLTRIPAASSTTFTAICRAGIGRSPRSVRKRLRARPVPHRPARRIPGARTGREEHRSVSTVSRRAARARQGALRRRQARAGRRGGPNLLFGGCTPFATTWPRTSPRMLLHDPHRPATTPARSSSTSRLSRRSLRS